MSGSTASVLGQRFTLDSLRAVMNDPDYAPLALLSAGLVGSLAGVYRFAHALVTDGVYQTLLRADKQTLHRRAAAWFAQGKPVLAAEHLERAADSGAAAAFLVAARALADAAGRERGAVHAAALRTVLETARKGGVDPLHTRLRGCAGYRRGQLLRGI